MVLLIISIVLFILDFAVAFLPEAFCLLCYTLIKIVSIILAITSIILVITNKGKNKLEIISMILLIFFFFFSYRGYSFAHDYSELRKKLNEDFGNEYKIVGISKYKKKECSNPYDRAFDVKLRDNSNITFQGQYCASGVNFAVYHAHYNYAKYYIPYYLEQFNNSNNSNISYEINDEEMVIITYSDAEKQKMFEFIEDLFSKDYNAEYQFRMHNKDKSTYNASEIISSWNDNYKTYLKD